MKDNIYFLINQLSILTQMGAFLFLYTHVLKNRFSFFVILGIEFAVQLVISFSCRLFNISAEIQTVLQFMLVLFVLLFLFEL